MTKQTEKYLVINGGSSSLKFSLYEMPAEKELINGYIEKIGADDCFWTLKINGEKIKHAAPLRNHSEAVEIMMKELIDNKVIKSIDEIKGIGHRVVHAGEYYKDSVLIDDQVMSRIEELTKLVPLHHPGEIAGIKAMQKVMPNVPNVAVFDTAFHQTMEKEYFMYPLPMEWYQKLGVRKYGFHGTSHKYITETMQEKLGRKDINLIICHIGSGASLSAIKDCKCVNTTMGLTPLDGLMMGTRCGSIDPSIIEYVCKETHKTVEEVTKDLNKASGLLGITGKSDLRDVEELAAGGDENAILALKIYVNTIVKYIAEYYFQLDTDVDAIVFTAGAGENGIELRENIINKISKATGIILDKKANNEIASYRSKREGIITTKASKIPVYVVPTDEEVMILRDTYNIINK